MGYTESKMNTNIGISMEQEEKEDENIHEEFQCCICLDLLYKPVVVACGHMACFWCIFKAMVNNLRESHCPVCRHPYNHFPRICKLLHFLLQKLYPIAFARREKLISEDEERSGNVSQQFDSVKFEASASAAVSLSLDSKNCVSEEAKATVTTSSSSETNPDVEQNGWRTNELPDGSTKKLVMSDLICDICKQLLFRPVVLNCGDVYCEACISKSSDTICKCPVCHSMHPSGFPKMCWVLEHFLEEEFPEQYAARKEQHSKENNGQLRSPAGEVSSLSPDKAPINVLSSLPRRGPKVHFHVGCDYCGMYPIVGERYKCKDCKERMGFDLCEGCYDSSCKLPGRFNQQHTEDHQFEKADLAYYHHILARLETVSISGNPIDYRSALLRGLSVHPEEIDSNDMQDHEDGSRSPEDVGDSPDTPIIILDDDDGDDANFYTSEDEDEEEDGEEEDEEEGVDS